MTTSAPRRAAVFGLALFVASPGCARDLARASAGAIGCSPRAIEVDHISVGWSETSWRARCRGQAFHCSGEDSPSCAPELETKTSAPTEPGSTR